jgi:hypothetical protein
MCENSILTSSYLRYFRYQAPVWKPILIVNPTDEFWNFSSEVGIVKEYIAPYFWNFQRKNA